MSTLTGGKKLAKVLAEVGDNAHGELKVGFLSGATYPETGTPVAQVAAWNEFGHGGKFPSPPRPFFRNMVAKDSGGWAKTLSGFLKNYDYDGEKALNAMGDVMKSQLQESITNTNSPALSKTTLMLRSMFGNNPHEIRARDVLEAQKRVANGEDGASGAQAKPLNWTGHMYSSVDYEVIND